MSRTDAAGGSHDPVQAATYDGERVLARLDSRDGVLAATTHRVLAFTPDGDGPTLRAVHRQNATSVTRETGGGRYRRPALGALGTGVASVVVGSVVSIGGNVVSGDGDGGSSGSAGELPAAEGPTDPFAPVRSVLELVGLLDDLLVAGGALLLLAGLVVTTLWLSVRRPVVTVGVAGDDPIRLSATGVTDREIRAFAEDGGLPFES